VADLRNSRFWDKELEGGLPDCRLSPSTREKSIVMRGRMAFEKVYCANCGVESGLVTAEWSAHVFYVCNACVGINGAPPGCVEAPEEIVRGTAKRN